jgi:hypothetical protein
MGGRLAVTRRLAALVLVLAALALHVGMTLPLWHERDAARRDFASAREERERLRARLSRLERRAAAGRAPTGDAAAARALRLALLRATERLPLDGVQIAIEAAGRGEVAARGRLTAEGAQADLLRAAERLADPASGLLVKQVELRAGRARDLRLEVDAFSLRATP